MSTEVAQPVTETPVVAPATEATPAVADAPVVEETKAEETKPAEEIVPTTATEATAEETKPVEPKESGHLRYHAPGNFLKDFLPIPPKSVFFWFGEEPVESKDLRSYLLKGKDDAHHTAAWAAQTGKGLLLFNKHGEDKAAPSGALNLADAEEIKEAGTTEFTFKIHNHKHKFDASTPSERDSWVASIKKIAEEAKAKKDEIVNSEGYKEALAKLKPAPLAAVTAPKVSEDAPKKSVEEASPAEERKAAKSRSRSRGPLGFLKSKKEDAKDKAEEKKDVEDKKEETAAVATTEPVATETTATEPVTVTDATAAPVIVDAVAPAEEKKEETTEEPKKENRRMSRFESFFKSKPKEAKKEETAAPATVEEPSVTEPAKTEETPAVVEPVAETAPVIPASEDAAKEEAKEEDKKEEVAPTKDTRKTSFLTGLKGFTQKVRSPSSEHPPVMPAEAAKTEGAPAVADATEAAPTAEPATATEEPIVNGEQPKNERRRSSFFNFGTINKKKAETSAATEEPAKTEESATEAAKPAEETAAAEVPKKSIEEKSEPASPKEHKESPFASIGRRVSKAIRGDKPKKETKPAPAVEESKDEPKTDASATEPAATLPEPVEQEETAAQPAAIGDVVPEAVTVGHAPQSTPTVSATA